MTMIFELHAAAFDDEYNFSRYFSILKNLFINNILHLQLSFIVHITFFLLLPTILSLAGIILSRFCTTNSITFVSFSLFSSILVSCEPIISTAADYNTKGLLPQVCLLVQFSFQQFRNSFCAFQHGNRDRGRWWTEKV